MQVQIVKVSVAHEVDISLVFSMANTEADIREKVKSDLVYIFDDANIDFDIDIIVTNVVD